MTVLAMYRNRILRMYQRIDQLDLLLTCMSGNMYILKNNIRTLHIKLVNDLGNCFLIARNRI